MSTPTLPAAEPATQIKAEVFATIQLAAQAKANRDKQDVYEIRLSEQEAPVYALADTQHQAEQAVLDYLLVEVVKLSVKDILRRVTATLFDGETT